nr:hypothetical protein [Tanacetum cinerariifolium]
MEQAKNRIGDWKNKSLSFAGRLQLCTIVISSMQVYWALVILIPKGVNTPRSDEDRLTLMELMVFVMKKDVSDEFRLNAARLLKLGGCSFWEVSIRADSSSGWRKLLQLYDTAWEDLMPWGFKVRWTHVVWYSHCISSHAFHLWLTLIGSLKTQDKLKKGDVETADLTTLRFPLYNMKLDSHSQLFFEWSFSLYVWCLVCSLAELDCIPLLMHLIFIHLIPISSQCTTRSIIGRIVVAATTYLIWLKRNNRLFNNSRRSPKDIYDMIMVTMRLKLLSFRFKNMDKVKVFLMKWNMPREFQIYGS